MKRHRFHLRGTLLVFHLRGALVVGLLATTVLGCPPGQVPPPPDRGVDVTPPDLLPPPPPIPFRHCAPLVAPSRPAKPLRLGGLRFFSEGYTFAPKPPVPRWAPKRLILGLVGESREALVGTLANLDWLRRHFARAHVDAIVVLGGLASDLPGSKALLHRLTLPPSSGTRRRRPPVLVLPGARASLRRLRALLASTPGVVDLSVFRVLRLPAATLISLPGRAQSRHLLGGAEGCAYTPEELATIAPSFAKLPSPRVLLAYTPPRGRGPAAIDLSAETHIGSRALKRLLTATSIRFGFFSDVRESGGRATTFEETPVKARTWTKSLFLNVGAIDALPEPTPSGTWLRPLGAIVEFTSGRARYRLLHPPRARTQDLVPAHEPRHPRKRLRTRRHLPTPHHPRRSPSPSRHPSRRRPPSKAPGPPSPRTHRAL